MNDAKPDLPAAIERWHDIARTGDASRLDGLLAPDVIFESPVVHTPQRGKEITAEYLGAAIAVLAGPQFRYVEQWFGPASAVLEFGTTIDGIAINGVDIIHWNAADEIVRFKVMVRPLKAIEIVRQRMAAALNG